MKTFGVLAAGWVVGGALIVLLAADWTVAEPIVTAESRPAVPALETFVSTGPIALPVVGVKAAQLRDSFAEARGGGSRTHRAMDIMAPMGTPVIAAVDGSIRKLHTSKAGGLTIYQFDRDERRLYHYAHLNAYANGLAEGAFVKQGTVIGYVGTTGNTNGTPHLHFSIEDLPPSKEWWKGQPVNPYPILTR